ncbi:hypothetical protein LAG73_12795 [Pseudoxanthomonas japonensis]|nr:hypothetical protein LAG73_12795 [Pseudoxanthomonas japonensis]
MAAVCGQPVPLERYRYNGQIVVGATNDQEAVSAIADMHSTRARFASALTDLAGDDALAEAGIAGALTPHRPSSAMASLATSHLPDPQDRHALARSAVDTSAGLSDSSRHDLL